jgi:MATE family multidrug resistance protein
MSSADGAAHQMVLQIINVSFLPAHAIAEAASVLVGHAVGAGRYELVRKVAARAVALGVAYSAMCLVVLAVAGGAIVSAMSGGDVQLASVATTLVHVSLAFLVADAANVIARGVLRGAGDVRYPAVIGVVTAWCFTPPLAWLLGVHEGYGAAGGWVGLAGEIIVGASIFWFRVARGSWRAAAEASREAVAHAPAAELADVPRGLENDDTQYVSQRRNQFETATPGPLG